MPAKVKFKPGPTSPAGDMNDVQNQLILLAWNWTS